MQRFVITVILGLLVSLSGCSQSKKDGCQDSTTCAGPTSSSKPTTSALNLNLESSHYYSSLTETWNEIKTSQISVGDLGTIQMYSDIIATPLADAKAAVLLAESQFALGATGDGNSKIPYLRSRIPAGVLNPVYNFEYKRFDSNNNIQEQTKGNFDIINGYAYLPFVNEKFDDKLFVTNVSSAQAESYTHQIAISATSSNSQPSIVKIIRFKVKVVLPLKGMKVVYSNSANNFTLKNRWSHYFTTNDYTPNNNWDFASIIDDQEIPDSIPVDVRFVFKTNPTLKLTQTIFEEETFDYLLYKTTKAKVFNRGVKYYQKTITLDSDNHFKSKMKINDTVVSLSGNSIEHRNISAGDRWKLTFTYDFNKNIVFPTSQFLLTPFRSECDTIYKRQYYPLATNVAKTAAEAALGVYFVCHPDTNDVLSLNSSQLLTNTRPLKDTFFDYFNYRETKLILDSPSKYIKDAGLFNGLKEVNFSVEGCVIVYIREASTLPVNPNQWEQKSIPTDDCGSGGFTKFSISKGDTIFNHLNEFAVQADISAVISGLGTAPVLDIPVWNFNGQEFNEVIY